MALWRWVLPSEWSAARTVETRASSRGRVAGAKIYARDRCPVSAARCSPRVVYCGVRSERLANSTSSPNAANGGAFDVKNA